MTRFGPRREDLIVQVDCSEVPDNMDAEVGNAYPCSFAHRDTAVGGPSFPLVQIVCKNCSYVMQFASTPIGLDAHMENLRQELSHTES
jgi:hypothetical protein